MVSVERQRQLCMQLGGTCKIYLVATLLKLDFRNAFAGIRYWKRFEIWHLRSARYIVHSVYSSPSSLLWGDKTIDSAEGVEQGDSLCPLLFCLTLHCHCEQLLSLLCVMYLDDVSAGGGCAA